MIEKQGSKVRFIYDLPSESEVYLVGDFNSWDETHTPLKKDDKGKWVIELNLPRGIYQFKYKINRDWFNDHYADDYCSNPYGGTNSVIKVNGIHKDDTPPKNKGGRN